MDFLNKAFAQVSDLFKSMTPGARITAGLLLAVVVVSVGYLTKYQVGGANEYLNGAVPFTNGELMAAESAFHDAGLSDYEVEGNRIRVPKSKRAEYQGALALAHIQLDPSAPESNLASSPFESRGERERRAIIKKQNRLALTIRHMKGIELASVIYSEITKPGFRKEKQSTATVSVKAVGGRPLDEKMVPTLRLLVSSSFAGLSSENVAIIDTGSGRSYSADGGGSLGPAGDKYGATKRMYETYWRSKILQALTYVDGAEVIVNANLTPYLKQIERKRELKKGSTNIASKESSKIESSTAPGIAGRPGLEAQRGGPNQPGAVPSSTKGQSNSKEETTSTQTNLPAGEDYQETHHHPLTPKRVAVSVAVPTTYFERIWQAENPPPEGKQPKKPTLNELQPVITAESKKIENHVLQLVPLPDLKIELTKLVTVSPFVPKVSEAVVEPGMTDNAMDWLGTNWGTLGMTGLAFFSLFMLRSMVRSGGGEALAPAPNRRDRADDDEGEMSEEAAKESKLKRFGESGPSLREELSDLVQEDPAAAAKILRGWIGSGV